jgi:hypothetical protein
MAEFVKLIDEIKTEGLAPPGFLVGDEIKKYESCIVMIREILTVLKNTAAILESNAVPKYLFGKYSELFNEFRAAHVNGLISETPQTPQGQNNCRSGMTN